MNIEISINAKRTREERQIQIDYECRVNKSIEMGAIIAFDIFNFIDDTMKDFGLCVQKLSVYRSDGSPIRNGYEGNGIVVIDISTDDSFDIDDLVDFLDSDNF